METIVTEGLVIHETDYGDYNKIVTLLTPEHGKLSAIVYGARRPKSHKKAASQFLSYGRYTLSRSRDLYRIEQCEPMQLFFTLSYDIEKLSYATYFTELAGRFAQENQPCQELLRLLLGALSRLEGDKKEPRLIKAAYELRLMCTSGYMPDLSACTMCAKTNGPFYFLPHQGTVLCGDCRGRDGVLGAILLKEPVLAAMRYVSSCEEKRVFSFRLAPDALTSFSKICEQYVTVFFGEAIRSLQYLKRVVLHNMDENGET